MTRTQFNELIKQAHEHSKELSAIMKKLLAAVEIDQQFKKEGPMYKVALGEYIPKWERRSVICIWGDTMNLETALARHYENCKDEKDTLKGVEPQ
jgi:hypothetical protein